VLHVGGIVEVEDACVFAIDKVDSGEEIDSDSE